MGERASEVDETQFVGMPATLADYDSFVSLFGELGTNDPIPDRQKWLKEIAPTTLFLRAGVETLGYAYFNLMGEMAYVAHVAVAPSVRGKGLGRQIMTELASRSLAAGMTSWCLNVKPDNVPARRLYESVGMRLVHSSCALRFSWDLLRALPASDAIQAGEVQPTDDAAIELELALPAGQIANFRSKGSRVLLWLAHGGRPVGFAAFDPGFPGAFPFRVERQHARSLLESMRRYAKPELPQVQVVAEANPDLAQLLIDAGAEVRMAFDHYRGPLPPPPQALRG
jgi:GNAT superfamily N-acetyltransferase